MNRVDSKQATRARLLEVAGRLFAERGFDGVSVREITRGAGTNLGAVTYHFGSKEGLFGAIILAETEPLRKFGEFIQSADLPPREKLSRILMEYCMFVLHQEPGLRALFIESMQGGSRLPANAKDLLKWRNKVIADIIRDGISRGDFRSCDADLASPMFMGLVMPYVLEAHMIEPRHRHEAYPVALVRRIVETGLDLMFHGLDARKEASS